MNYYGFWVYQGLAAAFSASTNITADTTGAALLLLAKCEVERLGILLREVNYFPGKIVKIIAKALLQPSNPRQLNSEVAKAHLYIRDDVNKSCFSNK